MNKGFINPLNIEKQAFRKDKPFCIVDGQGNEVASFRRLFDCAIVLRFLIGKNMSRIECDLAESLLRDIDEQAANERNETENEGSVGDGNQTE